MRVVQWLGKARWLTDSLWDTAHTIRHRSDHWQGCGQRRSLRQAWSELMPRSKFRDYPNAQMHTWECVSICAHGGSSG